MADIPQKNNKLLQKGHVNMHLMQKKKSKKQPPLGLKICIYVPQMSC